jgi:hypothetical protein
MSRIWWCVWLMDGFRLMTGFIAQLVTTPHRPQYDTHSYYFRLLSEEAASILILRAAVGVTSWLAVYRRSVRLGAKPFETHDRYIFFQLNTWGYIPHVTFSLTRGWICCSQLLLTLARTVILWFESRSQQLLKCWALSRRCVYRAVA